MRKRFIFLLLLLTACSSQKEWIYREVVSNSPQFSSTQLLYRPDNELIGVGVELLNGSFGTIGYLNVTCRQIPPLPNTPDAAIVVLQIEEERYPYKADRMEGGQRLLLPDAATEKLISSLENSQTVTIYLDGYMTEVKPIKFSKPHRKFSVL